MAYTGDKKIQKALFNVSDRAYFLAASAIFALVIFALAYVSSTLMGSDWTTLDQGRFYAMAQVIANGATPYLAAQDPKPPLIYFTLALPVLLGHKLLGGMLLVGACNFISAMLIMAMGQKLYGRFAGFLAGIVFTLNIAWAQGYFVMTEPFALTFILLSTYVLVFSEDRRRYLMAGLLAGVSIGFKQYALLIIPLLLYFMFREKELRKVPGLLIGMLIPLIIMFGAIFAVYGMDAGMAALHWSFGVAPTYLTTADMGDVTSYRAADPLILAANIIMCITVFTSLLIFAIANIVQDRRWTVYDEYFILAAIFFSATILVRQYLHYWILALPFIALICARQFRDKKIIFKDEADTLPSDA